MTRSPWTDRAACNGVNTRVFVIDDKRHGRNGVYASPVTRRKIDEALAICHSCPVVAECKAYMVGWPLPPRDIIIAALTPAQARTVWLKTNGKTPHRRTA
jgi:hypothetical protein